MLQDCDCGDFNPVLTSSLRPLIESSVLSSYQQEMWEPICVHCKDLQLERILWGVFSVLFHEADNAYKCQLALTQIILFTNIHLQNSIENSMSCRIVAIKIYYDLMKISSLLAIQIRLPMSHSQRLKSLLLQTKSSSNLEPLARS